MFTPCCGQCMKALTRVQRCGACRVQYYCSRECQRRHWSTHRRICENLARRNKPGHKISSNDRRSVTKLDVGSARVVLKKMYPPRVRESLGLMVLLLGDYLWVYGRDVVHVLSNLEEVAIVREHCAPNSKDNNVVHFVHIVIVQPDVNIGERPTNIMLFRRCIDISD